MRIPSRTLFGLIGSPLLVAVGLLFLLPDNARRAVRFGGEDDAVREQVFETDSRQLTKEEGDRLRRVKELIEALASPNLRPVQSYREIDISSSYDRTAQLKVLEAWAALLKEDTDAFPQLVSHTNDERYCCTVRGPNGDVNLSVGIVCRNIINNRIAIYNDVLDHAAPGAAPRSFTDNKLAEWLAKNRHRTLLDMQIGAAEHALTELKNPSEYERELRQSPITNDRQMKNIGRLEVLLKRLKTSNDAVQPKTIEGGGSRMMGIPDSDTGWSESHRFDAEKQPAKKS